MLFQSLVPQVFERLNIEADSSENLARKEEASKRLNYYRGQQLPDLETLLTSLFSEPEKLTKVALNIVRKIVNNLSQVYGEPPIRSIEGTEKDQNLYEEMIEQSSFNLKMKQCARYTKLLGNTLLRVLWRNERLDVDIITPNIVDVAVGDSPEILSRVLITDYGNSDRVEDVEYSLWDVETFTRLDYRGNTIYQEENPYRTLPFVSIFAYPPDSNFWLICNQDLISAQECLNLALVDLKYLMQQQSFGVGWIRGTPGGGNLTVDPGSLVELPEGGQIGFESQKAEIEQIVNAIDKIQKWTAVSYGLSAGSMSTDPQTQSGISKAWDSKELAEARRDDISLFRSYEKQVFELMRVVWNAHNSQKFSESANLKIDFADPRSEVDPHTQAKAWDLQLSMGVISQVDVIMTLNPDLATREDALAHLIKVKEETRELL